MGFEQCFQLRQHCRARSSLQRRRRAGDRPDALEIGQRIGDRLCALAGDHAVIHRFERDIGPPGLREQGLGPFTPPECERPGGFGVGRWFFARRRDRCQFARPDIVGAFAEA